MITFLTLQNRVLRWIDEVGDTSTTRDNVKDALNACHRTVCFAQNWPWMMWPREESFTTVDSVKAYALNPSVGKIRTLWDVDACDFAIILPRRQWESLSVNRGTQTRSPSSWVFGPVWPVSAQPSTVATISLVSDSTLQATTAGVYIIGIDDNNNEVSETIYSHTTIPVSSVQPFGHIMSISKVGTWTSNLMLKDHAGNTMANLDSGQDGFAYPTVEATENPIAGKEMTYTFLRKPRTLTYDGDIPEIHPNDLSEILVYGALLELTTYNTELGLKEQVQWQKRYDSFLQQLEDANDEAIVGSYPRTVRDVDLRNRVRWVSGG